MGKHIHLDRRRTQHSGVLSNGMWSAHGRALAGATTPHSPHPRIPKEN